MLTHLFAIAGLACLCVIWLGVQRLAARHGSGLNCGCHKQKHQADGGLAKSSDDDDRTNL